MLNTDLKFTTAGTMDSWEKQMDYHTTYGQGIGVQTVWSIYDEDGYGEIKFGNPHPFGDEVVIRHKCDVFGPYDVTVPVTGKTWGDVWVAADKAIVESGDLHHIFIEGFDVDGKTLNLSTGS
jgi:hypothetical protein